MVDPYAEIAGLDDLESDAIADDLDFYLDFARAADGPVLDLGAGTGRVALALAAAGHEVVALDLSDAMLAIARSRAAESGASIEFVHADMRAFDIGREFALVVCPRGGMRHLLALDDQIAMLQAVRRHLAPDGRFIADLPSWHTLEWQPEPGPLIHEWTRRDAAGRAVTKLSSAHPDPATQTQQLTLVFDVAEHDGALRRRIASMDLYTYTRRELELLFDRVGLEPDGWYGDYDLTPYGSESIRIISVARRGGE